PRGDRPDDAADPGRGVPGGPRGDSVSRLSLRADLSGEECRFGGVLMNAPRRIRTPQELQAVMHTDFAPSPQQWAAISAPLSPSVVIAGAGSGKTTLMAARVVYLVVTGQVRPEEVLGLTFTTKAASELRQRIREALLAADALPKQVLDAEEVIEPTVVTYNAYASTLLVDHGLRIGH